MRAGDIARAQERHADALAHYRQSILDQWRQVDAHTTILLLERFGYAESGLGNAARAVSWMAVADALRGRDAYPRTPAEAREWDRELARARAQLSEAAFQTAWEDGQRRETSDILGAVLAETAPE